MIANILQFHNRREIRSIPDRRQNGFIIIASMLMLVVLTLIQLAMTRSYWIQEMMGGNSMEKARAVNAAQSALQNAEWWLLQNPSANSATCAAGLLPPKACTTRASLTPSGSKPLAARVDYTPSGMSVHSNGGAGNYYSQPGYHIQSLYSSPDGSANYYRVTAFGYGGNQYAIAVVQSLFQINFNTNVNGNTVKNLGLQ